MSGQSRQLSKLIESLSQWGKRQGRAGWAFSLDINEAPGPNCGRVEATLGPHTAWGWTASQALHHLADGAAEDGWPDERKDRRA